MITSKLKTLKIFFILVIFIGFAINFSLSLSLSPDQKFACQLSSGNKYYLFDIENNKFVKKINLDDYYDNLFFISSDKVCAQKGSNLYILDSILLKKEKEFSLGEEVKNIKVIKEDFNETFFIVFTNYSIKYYKYNKENQSLKLITRKPLVKFNDVVIKENSIFVANNLFISAFKISKFLFFFTYFKVKNFNLNEVVYSLDVGNNKYAVLHYVSLTKRKVGWYTLQGQPIKYVDLEGKYHKLFLDFNEKDIVLFDQTNSLKILSFDGTIRESSTFPENISAIEKLKEGWLLFTERGNFIVLDQNFNIK